MNLSYLAGMIDARGYIGIALQRGGHSHSSGSHRLVLSVRMADRRAVLEAADWTDLGNVRKKRPTAAGTEQYEWTVWTKQAAQLLAAVRPHLITKGEQADIALEFQQGMRRSGSSGLAAGEWDRREQLAQALKIVNNKETYP